MSSNSSSSVKTLEKIIKRLPAQMVYYGSALGAIVLAGGGQLPPGLEFVAGGIGANLLSNLAEDQRILPVANGLTCPVLARYR